VPLLPGAAVVGQGFYVSSFNTYKTDGDLVVGLSFRAGQFVRAFDSTANQVLLGWDGTQNAPAISFGSSLDTNLYRFSAGIIKTDGALITGSIFYPGSYIDSSGSGGAANFTFISRVSADAQYRLIMSADGKMLWGSGALSGDTNLYRSGVAQLKSDNNFQAVDGVATKVKAGTPSDSDFTTTPPTGTIVVDTSANKIWARTGAATWKGVVIA
jgi:hypothetical protein